MKRILSALALTFILTSSAFALTDSEYKEFMKNSDFAAADKEMQEAWNEAKSKMPPKFFERLQSKQREWLSHGRDKGAAQLMKADPKMSRVEAYTQETGSRLEAILGAIDASKLTPDDAQGFFILNDNGRHVEVNITLEKNRSLTAEFFGDNGSIWEANGRISANVLTVSNDKGSAAITYWDTSYPEIKSDKKLRDSGINIDGNYGRKVNAY